MKAFELIVMLLIVSGLLVWAYYSFRRWLYEAPEPSIPEAEEEIDETEAVRLLQDAGYEVVNKSIVVPVVIRSDGGAMPPSRLFIDYIVRKDGLYYVVKTARIRKPMVMTSAGIRERLLPYAFVYEEAEGVIYVDPEQGTVRLYQFELQL